MTMLNPMQNAIDKLKYGEFKELLDVFLKMDSELFGE